MTHTRELHSNVKIRSVTAAFLRMDAVEDFSYPLSLAMSQAGTLAPVFIYYFVAELIGTSPEVGDDYFTFVVIGFAISTALQSALSGFGGSLQRAQNRGTFETFLVEPIPWVFLPFAMNLWKVVLGILGATLIMTLGFVLGAEFVGAGIPEFLVLIALGILASIGIGIVSASLVVLAKRAQPILALYGLASSLLAGAIFPVDLLPDWLQAMSWLLPHTYVINAARDVLMVDPGTFTIAFSTAVIALTIFNIVVFAIGLWLFSKSLQYARKMGMLSGY